MAVVDFFPRYRSKQSFGWVRSIADKVQIPVVFNNTFRLQCALRRAAHIALCASVFLIAHFSVTVFERLQAYIAPYL